MFSEDLAAFFDTAHGFAIVATYQGATSVTGIFENEYLELDGDSVGAASSEPRFLCQASDVPNVAHGHSIVINGVSYQVCGVEPDGTGLVRLALEAV